MHKFQLFRKQTIQNSGLEHSANTPIPLHLEVMTTVYQQLGGSAKKPQIQFIVALFWLAIT
jgi:hypothetical protein